MGWIFTKNEPGTNRKLQIIPSNRQFLKIAYLGEMKKMKNSHFEKTT